MKKLFLFIGVILWCLHFSCKKDNPPPPPPPPPPPIDSFLLHPPPVLDSLPIPLTIGTWWKYQSIDSTQSGLKFFIDSSIELITVVGKVPYIITVFYDGYPPVKVRYDTVQSFMLEVKNLTAGVVDTNYAVYYDSHFKILNDKSFFNSLSIKVPQLEGTQVISNLPNLSYDTLIGNENASVTVLNNTYVNCYYNQETSGYDSHSNSLLQSSTTFLKPSVGFVFLSYHVISHNIYSLVNNQFSFRKLIDYHIAP